MYVFIQPFRNEYNLTQGKYFAGFNKFKFRITFFIDRFQHHGKTTQSVLWFAHNKKSKVGDPSQGLPEDSLFNSYYTVV